MKSVAEVEAILGVELLRGQRKILEEILVNQFIVYVDTGAGVFVGTLTAHDGAQAKAKILEELKESYGIDEKTIRLGIYGVTSKTMQLNLVGG